MSLINYTRDRLNRSVGSVGVIRYCSKCGRKGRLDHTPYSAHANRVVHVLEANADRVRYTDVCIIAKVEEVAA